MWAVMARKAVVWSVAAAAVAAMAQVASTPKVSSGLWEIQVTSQIMGRQHLTKYRSCATPQTIQDTFMSAMQQDQNSCVKSNQKLTSTGFSTDFSCNGGEMTGHVDVIFDSDTAAHGTMHMTGSSNGYTIQASNSTTANLVSSDCGGVPPGKSVPVR